MTYITPEQKMKLLLPDRPWESEPDNAEWVDEVTGYKCRIHRAEDLKHLCGYVGIPKSHPMWGQDYEKIDKYVVVHGGVTYSKTDEDGVHWVGFDCAHADDFVPALWLHKTKNGTDIPSSHWELGVYRDWGYADAQVRALARHLHFIEEK
jgi:hypothetical protein